LRVSDVELRVLLAGYVDGELDDESRARVEAALAEDPALRSELEEMRRLASALGLSSGNAEAGVDLERFWDAVESRLERQASWMLLLFGLAGLSGAGAYLFLSDPSLGWWAKGPAICAALGAAGLLFRVWRERRNILYLRRFPREVHR
jgi:anti-sigma factor RsiW